MNKTTLESLEEALERLEQIDGMYSWAHLLYEVREALAEQEKQEPVAWHDKIKGMEVSVDVSTGEDDDYYRVFGRVDGVMLESCGAQNDIILVIEESRNYAAPVERQWVDLTDDEIGAVMDFGYATDSELENARAAIAAFKEKNK